MKICLKCDKPINEQGEEPYVMLMIKKKGKIMEFVNFHFSCWEGKDKSSVVKKVKEKTDSCSNCNKELKFWNSYINGEGYLCKECWDKKEKKLEDALEKEEKELVEKSKKRK